VLFHFILSSSPAEYLQRENSISPLAIYANSVCSPQKLAAYDEDAELSVTTLLNLPTCNGRIGATGMCLGGHLAYRCALDPRVAATVCYFPTDIHSHSLGEGMRDDSLERAGDIKRELVMVCSYLEWKERIFLWGRMSADLVDWVLRFLGRVSGAISGFYAGIRLDNVWMAPLNLHLSTSTGLEG